MASELYLSRFRAHNFRCFGEVDIALPAGPGLVLLEGPNGLGKTSWLEALEWVLSGRVHRWHQQDEQHGLHTDRHIARIDASGASCSVEVEVEFGEHKASWSGGAAPAPATWLCDDLARWSLRPDNLNGFLRGTHVLPQSSSLRLLHLGAEERWNQVLRVVSGYSEIDDLSAALQRSKRPLTTEVQERDARVAQARSVRDAWRERVAAILDRRARAEASADLLAPSRAASMLLAEEATASAPSDSEAGAREMTAHLNGLLASRRSERGQLETRRASFASLVEVPARWLAAQNALALAEDTVRAREAIEQRLRESLEQRQADEQAAVEHLSEAEALASTARCRTETLARLGETVVAIPGASDDLAAARRRASDSDARLAEAIARREEARRLAELRRAYEDLVKAHKRRLTAHEATAASWRRIQELCPQREAVARTGESLKASLAVALTALQATRAPLAERSADTARARELAESVRTAAGEVQGLVVALARHVDDHTMECPLCLANYPGIGELRKQVEEAKARQGPAVAHAEDALREAAAREAAAANVVRDAVAVHAKADRACAENQAELSALNREIGELRDRMTGINVGHEEEELQAVRAALDSEQADLAALSGAELEAWPVLGVRIQKAEEEVRTAETNQAAAAVATEQAATTLAQLRVRDTGLRQQLDVDGDADLMDQVADARASQGHAEEALRMAQEARAAVQAARERAEAEVTAATKEAVSARAARDQRQAEQQEITRPWTSHALSLPPSGERLAEAGDALAARLDALDERIAAIMAAVEGVGRWQENAALDREAGELDAVADGAGPEAWESQARRLQGRVGAAEQAHLRAETVRADIETMANNAEKRRALMRSELQARLGPILAPMLRSLIVDPRIAQAVIALAEERKKTRVRATVGKEATDLLALASEGQLSGVNLAVQLSMALAFRWCRWPAVLLDDPAQYSDVVHSTNLVETLRVLALHHGFQVFLATHERDFALYVESKFRNDGLPAARVMFRQPSDPAKGVVPRLALNTGDGP